MEHTATSYLRVIDDEEQKTTIITLSIGGFVSIYPINIEYTQGELITAVGVCLQRIKDGTRN